MRQQQKTEQQFNIPEELQERSRMRTSKFRMSYAHLCEPWTGDPEKPAKYGVQCLFKKDDPWLKEAKAVVKDLLITAFGPNALKLVRAGKLRSPFRDGDEEFPDDELYSGITFFNANGATEGKRPPDLVDKRVRPLRGTGKEEDYFYSGAYGIGDIKFYPYNQKGGKGVAAFLFGVQFAGHGEPIGGGKSASEVFDVLDDDDDDDYTADVMDDDDDIPF